MVKIRKVAVCIVVTATRHVVTADPPPVLEERARQEMGVPPTHAAARGLSGPGGAGDEFWKKQQEGRGHCQPRELDTCKELPPAAGSGRGSHVILGALLACPAGTCTCPQLSRTYEAWAWLGERFSDVFGLCPGSWKSLVGASGIRCTFFPSS